MSHANPGPQGRQWPVALSVPVQPGPSSEILFQKKINLKEGKKFKTVLYVDQHPFPYPPEIKFGWPGTCSVGLKLPETHLPLPPRGLRLKVYAIFLKKANFILYAWVFCLCARVCGIAHMPSVCRVQKAVSHFVLHFSALLSLQKTTVSASPTRIFFLGKAERMDDASWACPDKARCSCPTV